MYEYADPYSIKVNKPAQQAQAMFAATRPAFIQKWKMP